MSPAPPTTTGTCNSEARWPCLTAFLLLLLVYVLSVGPVVRLVEEELLPQTAVYVYEPLRALCLNSPTLTTAIRSYVDLWRK